MITILFILFLSSSLWAQNPESHHLAPGEILNLKAPPGQAIKISDSRVLQLKDGGHQIHLFAKKRGHSFVHVGSRVHEVFVLEEAQLLFFKAARQELQNRLGLELEIVDKELLIKGRLHRWSDWEWLSRLADQHQASYRFSAQVDEDIQTEALEHINSRLRAHSLSPVSISWQGEPRVGAPPSVKKDLKTYRRVLSRFGLEPHIHHQQLGLKPTVEVEVVMAELVQRVDEDLGLQWSPFGEFQVLPKASLQTSLTATLQALESRGLGKILATPRILCRSGGEAEFHSGGEFPIPVTEYQSHYKSHNIIWKKHGIVLRFKPVADHQGRMSLHIYAELSVLSDQQAGGVPALLINKIESQFDLSRPQTVALSGLIRQDWHRGKSGLPGLSQIPVLGALFGSQKFLNRRSELVVFVTPKIVPETAATVELPKGWQRDSF